MPAFEWTDSLAVGIDVIDKDHKVLVDQLNMLADTLDTGADEVITASVINVLVDYTAFHFERERRMMDTTGFPGAAQHLREHDLMVAKVKAMNKGFTAGTIEAGELFKFLKVWLTQHIMKSDKDLAAHLKVHGGARIVPAPDPIGTVDWRRLSVMVVDDQFAFRSLLRNILNTFGVTQVQEARDGVEAYDRLNSMPADVILVDDKMEPGDGLEFTRWVRRTDSPNPKAVILLMASGEITREFVTAATDAGVHDLMLKPLSPKTVRNRIEYHLTNPVPFREVDKHLVPIRRAPTQAAAGAKADQGAGRGGLKVV